jgi:hypothetical protein
MAAARLQSGAVPWEPANDPSKLVLAQATAECGPGMLLRAGQEGGPEAAVQLPASRGRERLHRSAPRFPCTPRHGPILPMPAPGAEQDRDPSTGERRLHATIGFLERTAEIRNMSAEHPQVFGALGPLVRRVELVGDDPRQDGRVAQRRSDRLVTGLAR